MEKIEKRIMFFGTLLIVLISAPLLCTGARTKVEWEITEEGLIIDNVAIDKNSDLNCIKTSLEDEAQIQNMAKLLNEGSFSLNEQIPDYIQTNTDYDFERFDNEGNAYFSYRKYFSGEITNDAIYQFNNFTISKFNNQFKWVKNITIDFNLNFEQNFTSKIYISKKGNIFASIKQYYKNEHHYKALYFVKINENGNIVWKTTIAQDPCAGLGKFLENDRGDVFVAYSGNNYTRFHLDGASGQIISTCTDQKPMLETLGDGICLITTEVENTIGEDVLIQYVNEEGIEMWDFLVEHEFELEGLDDFSNLYLTSVETLGNHIGMIFQEQDYNQEKDEQTEIWKAYLLDKNGKEIFKKRWKLSGTAEEALKVWETYGLYPTSEGNFYFLEHNLNMDNRGLSSVTIKFYQTNTGTVPGVSVVSATGFLLVLAIVQIYRKDRKKEGAKRYK